MEHAQTDDILSRLEQGAIEISDLERYDAATLKPIGRKLALKYRHAQNKEDTATQKYLELLINVRTLVKTKMQIRDVVMERYQKEKNA